MFYAVNLADLAAHMDLDNPLGTPLGVLLNRILTEEEVLCESDLAGHAVRVDSGVPESQWQAIYTMIREGWGRQKGIEKHALRIYASETGKGSWERI